MGILEDTLFIIVGVLVSAIVLGVGLYALAQIQSIPQFNTATTQIVKDNFNYLDGLIAFGMVLLFAASIILAYFLPTHPAFFFTFFLTAFVTFIISPIFSNLYAKIAVLPPLATSFSAFPIAALVIGNLPFITFVLSAAIAVVSYGKRFNEQSYAGGI